MVYFALQLPAAQTFIINKVTAEISKQLNGKIEIEHIYLIFFNKLIAKNVSIVSPSPKTESGLHFSDTLLSCRKISVTLSSEELFKFKLKLKRVKLSNGVFNLQNEDSLTTNLTRIFKIDKNRPKKKKKGGSIDLLANSLRLKNFRFNLKNPAKYVYKGDSTINFANLRVDNINLKINNIEIKDDTLRANIEHISGRDSSGYKLVKLQGKVQVCAEEARIEKMYLADNFSKINAEYFYMRYEDPRNLADFVNAVKLGIALQNSKFSFKTLGKIAPSLKKSDLTLILNGNISGPIRNLRSEKLHITSESGATALNIKFHMAGLPDIRETMCNVNIKDCRTNAGEIATIISSINGSAKSRLIANLSPGVEYQFKGQLTGLPDDFVAHGLLHSSLGEISLDVLLKNDSNLQGFVIEGDINTNKFNIGKLLNNKLLGNITLKSDLSALIKKGGKGINLSVDSVRINGLELNSYNYTNIFAIGKYENEIFDGRIICHDPNLDFIFQGIVPLNKVGDGEYKFYADVPYANLHALNVDKRDSISLVKFRVSSNIRQTEDKDLFGNLKVYNINYRNSRGSYNLGTISMLAKSADSSYITIISAPFLKFRYEATAPLSKFVRKSAALALYNNIPNIFTMEQIEKAMANQKSSFTFDKNEKYDLNLTLFKTGSICQLLKPGLYIHDSTSLNATIDGENNLRVKLLSNRLAINGNYLKGIDMDISNRDSMLKAELLCKNILIAGIKMDDSRVKVSGKENLLDFGFNFRNDSLSNSYGKFNGNLHFMSDTILATLDPVSLLCLKGAKWHFKPAKIMLTDSTANIDNFGLDNGEQHFSVKGAINNSGKDSLLVSLNQLDLDIFNLFLNKSFNIKGYLSGDAKITSIKQDPNMFLNLTGDSIYVYNTPVGAVKIQSRWSHEFNRFNLLLSTMLDGKTKMLTTGYYIPKNSNIYLNAKLDKFALNYFEPFLSGIISESSGTVTGNLELSGKANRLKLVGKECKINNFGFKVNFIQVPFVLNGTVDISENGIKAKNLTIKDLHKGRGRVEGGLQYNYFKDLRLDTRVDFTNLHCLNTNELNSSNFYGEAFASGRLNIKGPLDKLILDLNVAPSSPSSLHIPLDAASTATKTNLLTFKEKKKYVYIDPYDTIINASKRKKADSQMQVLMRANMNPNMNIFLEINKEVGDVISANGNGTINMNINPSKDIFTMFGDYHVNMGHYRFVLPGFAFASKDFEIQPGGTIIFNGNIENTNIDLTAAYKTKAAINTLIADTSSVSTRRIVECTIGMSGNLMNPILKFNITIPDLEPTVKVRVESALNSDDKIQKQFAALLISGGFLPDEQSGITNNATILHSNASEMLSKQLNNIFEQLGIPLDLGLNYQPTTNGNDLFDVAVSTQLFNNRLLINGNIGNDPYSATNNRSVIGNIDIEIKMDKNGKLRVSLFSHASDKYSNYLDDSQRSGIGVSYQQEFNHIKEIFRRKSKEQREFERKAKEERKAERKAAKLKESVNGEAVKEEEIEEEIDKEAVEETL